MSSSVSDGSMIMNGNTILRTKVGRDTFLDSYQFLHMRLANFPETFGLTEMKKGYFPHLANTVKSQLSERPLSETTGLFEDDGRSRLFSLLSIAIKLPIIRISVIRKNQFSEVIRQSRSNKLLLNYPSRFEVRMSRMVIMISLFGRVRFTHPSDLANKVATDTGLTFTLLSDEPLSE